PIALRRTRVRGRVVKPFPAYGAGWKGENRMRRRTIVLVLLVLGAATAAALMAATAGRGHAAAQPTVRPLIDDAQLISSDSSPPSEAACNAAGRRCFNPTAMANSYDYAGLHAAGIDGRGQTIAVVDSFGSSTIRHDLAVFDTAFGLQHMCGEGDGIPESPAGNCAPGAPGP